MFNGLLGPFIFTIVKLKNSKCFIYCVLLNPLLKNSQIIQKHTNNLRDHWGKWVFPTKKLSWPIRLILGLVLTRIGVTTWPWAPSPDTFVRCTLSASNFWKWSRLEMNNNLLYKFLSFSCYTVEGFVWGKSLYEKLWDHRGKREKLDSRLTKLFNINSKVEVEQFYLKLKTS